MKMQRAVYDEILQTCPAVPPESGGLLGGRGGVITQYIADSGLGNGYDRYAPNVQVFNAVLAEWQKDGVQFFGLYHSHFPQGERLSDADVFYIETILRATANAADTLYFPLVFPKEKMIAYRVALSDGQVQIQPDGITLV
ncbi:MAG: hypothetical protein Q4E21_07940 [Clostridia bacterium]|nr:hypothetical protein [Clostridia bacterium]